ncbi:MAG TPA: hypothetical protein V6D06_19165, partial [Trichocoleus sp.]
MAVPIWPTAANATGSDRGKQEVALAPANPIAAEALLVAEMQSGSLVAQAQGLPSAPLTLPITLPNYDPARDAFQFTNAELSTALTFATQPDQWQRELTGRLMELFGTQVCVGQDARNCILTAAAQTWLDNQLQLMRLGVGEGMAPASLSLWQPAGRPQRPWWQRLLSFIFRQVVYQLTRNIFDLQAFVANLFLLQGVDEVALPTQRIRETLTPIQILNEIISAMRSTPEDPYTMGVYRLGQGGLVEGQTLTPYRVEPHSGGQFRVYVYDSNYPAGRGQAPYVLFDVPSNSWSYQPAPTAVAYSGSAQSKNLDLTKLSWRAPKTPNGQIVAKGPFTCPFCEDATASAPGSEPTPASPDPAGSLPAPAKPAKVEIALIGEGGLTVSTFDPATARYTPASAAEADRVPVKGGLNRSVPASYQIPVDAITQPLKVEITAGLTGAARSETSLQVTGPGYTATVEGLTLSPQTPLTLYVYPQESGPELTFVAQQSTTIPRLAVQLEDFLTEPVTVDDEGESGANRQVSLSKSVSYSFTISSIGLPAGKAVAIALDRDNQRFYFGDDDSELDQYRLSVEGRTRTERVTVTETRRDHPD